MAPIVKKLSYARSGKTPKNRGLIPMAFQPAFISLLYHVPVEDSKIIGFSASPEQEDK